MVPSLKRLSALTSIPLISWTYGSGLTTTEKNSFTRFRVGGKQLRPSRTRKISQAYRSVFKSHELQRSTKRRPQLQQAAGVRDGGASLDPSHPSSPASSLSR